LAVEIGTNAPGEVAALAKMTAPHAVVITSIGEGHLEGLGRIEDVAEEKASLLKHVRSDGLAVVQIDRPEINPFLKLAPARTITVGSSPGARLCVCDVVGDMHGIAFTLDGRFRVALSMPGLHHATNAAAAFAVARWFGLDPQRILRRLRSFVPPEGRTRVHDLGPVTLIDDAYNANPPGMLAAITALGRGATGRRILVMGDMLELGHAAPDLHRDVVRAVAASGIEVFVPVGPATVLAAREALGGSADVMIEPCDDASQACERLRTLVKPHDTIWIKGSRAMGLDAVVCDLREGLGSGAAVAQGSST
ncbi:MAG: Mur ligase family protein, partial [Phycisphaerae bacterium]